jgi:carbonic anhydrase/acetyltransferase-like protein (isoleucine patch superfamily)
VIEHAEIPPRLPDIHPGAFVATGAVVTGDVTLGDGASVWFQTVMRGDSDRIVIGRRSNVQDLTIVHNDVGCPTLVGAEVTIGHHAVIHGCVIEDRCLIGMGAILLSGSRIGTGSLVAAGALVRERQEIPPGSLVVGAPARVAGQVKPAHTEAIQRGADHYAALARSYAAAGLAAPGVGCSSTQRVAVAAPGIVGEIEWEQWVTILEETPSWILARLGSTSDDETTSALEIVNRRIDDDRQIASLAAKAGFRATPEKVTATRVEDFIVDEYRTPTAMLEHWAAFRASVAEGLRRMGPSLWGVGLPGDAGRTVVSGMVRGAAERDLATRRAIRNATEGR